MFDMNFVSGLRPEKYLDDAVPDSRTFTNHNLPNFKALPNQLPLLNNSTGKSLTVLNPGSQVVIPLLLSSRFICGQTYHGESLLHLYQNVRVPYLAETILNDTDNLFFLRYIILLGQELAAVDGNPK